MVPAQVESREAFQAFEDYYGLGPERSLLKLYHYYKKNQTVAPTLVFDQLKGWHQTFGWESRVVARDGRLAEEYARANDAVHMDYRLRRIQIAQESSAAGQQFVALLKNRLTAALSEESDVPLSLLLNYVPNAVKLLEWAYQAESADIDAVKAEQPNPEAAIAVLRDQLPPAEREEFDRAFAQALEARHSE
jgi:hypothetical protein